MENANAKLYKIKDSIFPAARRSRHSREEEADPPRTREKVENDACHVKRTLGM